MHQSALNCKYPLNNERKDIKLYQFNCWYILCIFIVTFTKNNSISNFQYISHWMLIISEKSVRQRQVLSKDKMHGYCLIDYSILCRLKANPLYGEKLSFYFKVKQSNSFVIICFRRWNSKKLLVDNILKRFGHTISTLICIFHERAKK